MTPIKRIAIQQVGETVMLTFLFTLFREQSWVLFLRRLQLKPGLHTLWILLIGMHNSYAVPAAPVVHTLTQAEGTPFYAKQWGDETLHGWETVDGYTILYDKYNSTWYYARYGQRGELIASSYKVAQDPVPPNMPRHARPLTNNNTLGLTLFSNESNAVVSTPSPAGAVDRPLHGRAEVLVLLINFNDTQPTYTRLTDFHQLLFGTGTNSLREYYEEVSYNHFRLSPGAGPKGWYTARHHHHYYGEGFDKSIQLVQEAISAADVELDFNSYDQDGDCRLDMPVIVIHQGEGEESSGQIQDIWSHYGRKLFFTEDTCAHNQYRTIQVTGYTLQPELNGGRLSTIGVFAHEYGHALGLPDFYDTDYTSEGLGHWDVMATGAWNRINRVGDSPAHMNPWSKYALGWLTPTVVTTPLVNEPIEQNAFIPDVYQIGNGNPFTGGEYFLIENRQQVGFDSALPSSGLAVWHIAEAKNVHKVPPELKNQNNTQECYPAMDCTLNHYHVALVQADNQWDLERQHNSGDAGDLFPGSSLKTQLNSDTAAPSQFYQDNNSFIEITDISDSTATMTATLSMITETIIPQEQNVPSEEPSLETEPSIVQTDTSSLQPVERIESATEGFSGISKLAATQGVHVQVIGSGHGYVSSYPQGIACGNQVATTCTHRSDFSFHCLPTTYQRQCEAQFKTATPLTLTPVAAADSVFIGWGGDESCGENNRLLTHNKLCIAFFERIHTLEVSVVGQGQVRSYDLGHQPTDIFCGAGDHACLMTVSQGTQVILVATPAEGSQFLGWQQGCRGHQPYVPMKLKADEQCVAQFGLVQ